MGLGSTILRPTLKLLPNQPTEQTSQNVVKIYNWITIISLTSIYIHGGFYLGYTLGYLSIAVLIRDWFH